MIPKLLGTRDQFRGRHFFYRPRVGAMVLRWFEHVTYIVHFISIIMTSAPLQISSIQFSRSVVSDSLRPHGPQHARPPCPSPTPRAHPNPCPLNQWCHPTISSSVPFFFCPQSFPTSGSFQMSQLFTWGGQSIGVSASKSVLAVNTQDWSPLGWTGWISLSATADH